MTDSTPALLARWAAGDRGALALLVEDNLGFLRDHVQRHLGRLVAREDGDDVVQDAVLEVMRDAPRFIVDSRNHFRALVARLVENLLRDRYEWHAAQKRDYRREQALSRPSGLVLDASMRDATRPSQAADRAERTAWVQLAIELLAPDDRRLIQMREWAGESFATIGAQFAISENTARMRFQAALRRLGAKLNELRTHGIGRALGDDRQPEPPEPSP